MSEENKKNNDKSLPEFTGKEYQIELNNFKDALHNQEVTKKDKIKKLADLLEKAEYLKDLISEKITNDLKGYVTSSYIRQVLNPEQKQQHKNTSKKEEKNVTDVHEKISSNEDKKKIELSTTTSGHTTNEPPKPQTQTNYDDVDDGPTEEQLKEMEREAMNSTDPISTTPNADYQPVAATQTENEKELRTQVKELDADRMKLRNQNLELRSQITKHDDKVRELESSIETLKLQVKTLSIEKQQVIDVKNKTLENAAKHNFHRSNNIPLQLDDKQFINNIELTKIEANFLAKKIHEWLAKFPKLNYFLVQNNGLDKDTRINIPKPEFIT